MKTRYAVLISAFVMPTTFLLSHALFGAQLFAQEGAPVAKPKDAPTVAQLQAVQAEVESLKAQLAELQLTFQYAERVCRLPDVMQSRLATVAAAQKLEAAKATKPKESK